MSFLNFINCYSPLIQAISTIVLVIITCYYAIQTRRTVIEMDKTRKIEFLPILTIENTFPIKQGNNTYSFQIITYNRGKGIAQNPRIFFPTQKVEPLDTLTIDDTTSRSFNVSEADINKVWHAEEDKQYIDIKYFDIFNREIITRALIQKTDNGFKINN